MYYNTYDILLLKKLGAKFRIISNYDPVLDTFYSNYAQTSVVIENDPSIFRGKNSLKKISFVYCTQFF